MSAKCSISSSMNSFGPSSDSAEMKPCDEEEEEEDEDEEEGGEGGEAPTPAAAATPSPSGPSLLELAISWSNSA